MSTKTPEQQIADLTAARDSAVAELRLERMYGEQRTSKLEGVLALLLAKFSAVGIPGPVPALVGSTLMALRMGKKVDLDIEFTPGSNNANITISVDGVKL